METAFVVKLNAKNGLHISIATDICNLLISSRVGKILGIAYSYDECSNIFQVKCHEKS